MNRIFDVDGLADHLADLAEGAVHDYFAVADRCVDRLATLLPKEVFDIIFELGNKLDTALNR